MSDTILERLQHIKDRLYGVLDKAAQQNVAGGDGELSQSEALAPVSRSAEQTLDVKLPPGMQGSKHQIVIVQNQNQSVVNNTVLVEIINALRELDRTQAQLMLSEPDQQQRQLALTQQPAAALEGEVEEVEAEEVETETPQDSEMEKELEELTAELKSLDSLKDVFDVFAERLINYQVRYDEACRMLSLALIRRCADEGLTQYQMAKRLGMSQPRISTIMKKYGIKRKTKTGVNS